MSAAPFEPATVAPPEWSRMIGKLHEAEIARAAIRAADTVAAGAVSENGSETAYWAQDQAVVAYSRAADAVIDDLLALRDSHVLGRITLLLGRKERG